MHFPLTVNMLSYTTRSRQVSRLYKHGESQVGAQTPIRFLGAQTSNIRDKWQRQPTRLFVTSWASRPPVWFSYRTQSAEPFCFEASHPPFTSKTGCDRNRSNDCCIHCLTMYSPPPTHAMNLSKIHSQVNHDPIGLKAEAGAGHQGAGEIRQKGSYKGCNGRCDAYAKLS